MAEEVLKVLANPTNQAILNLLSVEPTYPRKIGALLSLSETEVARRVKHMETIGILQSSWNHIGKNVKMYRLVADSVSVRFTAEGLRLDMRPSAGGQRTTTVVNPFTVRLPTPTEFVGRTRELEALDASEPVVVVEGMPGVGKTSLLATYGRSKQASHAVFWLSFRGVESLNWLANRFALFLAQHGDRSLLEAVEQGVELAEKREGMLAGMDDPRFVVLLDDVHAVQDDDVRGFLHDAIGRIRRAKLVLATRERPRAGHASARVRHIRLGGLEDDDVLQLLAQKGVTVDPALLPKLRDEVGGHPLALNLFLEAAREMDAPIEKLLDRIPERNLEEYLLDEVCEGLSDAETHVLAVASVFRIGFTLDDLRALAKRDPEAALVKLRRRLLVQEHGGEYGLHEVIRNYFSNILQNKAELQVKAAEHYLGQGTIEGRLEAMHHLLAAGRRDRVLQLLEENLDLNDFDYIDGGLHNLYLATLEIFTEAEVGDGRRWALIEDEKGDIWFHRGEYARALEHYDAAGAHFDGRADPERAADLAWKRAMALMRLGRHAKAAKACRDGLAVAPADGVARRRLDELAATFENGHAKSARRARSPRASGKRSR